MAYRPDSYGPCLTTCGVATTDREVTAPTPQQALLLCQDAIRTTFFDQFLDTGEAQEKAHQDRTEDWPYDRDGRVSPV